MVINGLIDISMTALIGRMTTVAFIGDVPMFRPLSEKKLRYTLKKYSPDALVLFIKGNVSDDLSTLLDIYSHIWLFAYDYNFLTEFYREVDGVVWLVPYETMLVNDIPNMSFRVSEDVFNANRKWFVGKEKRVEVVSPTLNEIFQNKDGVRYRKFWL
ncbi:hypothetical protein GM182_05085 [bacterium 3DAC]|nr:hypothetical protein GM182_05085 [bacterium 3DAC]